MIIALAGRRVDAVDAKEQRFPSNPEHVEVVRQRIRAILQAYNAVAIVSSAACGADLLALSEAGNLGVRRRIVLPFERERFRETSVTDRPGEWGPLYDLVLNDIKHKSDLLVLEMQPGYEAYAKASHVIVDEALSLGQLHNTSVIAVLVWDGVFRGLGDLTEEFGLYARAKGIRVVDVMTL